MAIANTSKGPIEYRIDGTGPAVIVLNGGHCSRSTRLSHEQLSNYGFTVVIPSRPGYDSTPSYVGKTAQEAADAISALLDTLKLDKVDLIGISAAGPTALAFAVKYGNRLRRLILESAVTLPWNDKLKKQSRVIFGSMEKITWGIIRFLLWLIPNTIIKIIMKQLTILDIDEVMKRLEKKELLYIKQMIHSFRSGKGFINDIEHIVDDLSSINVPVLVMYSPYDGSVSPENSKRVINEVQKCTAYEVQTDSHLIWIGAHSIDVWKKRLNFLRGKISTAT